ncbi:hypothetical protein EJ02DRAFT_449099 [Clathrospora elynae]|uniref:Uncharacterized protein n=1 Tax=Clathrospora elynae TaxID=706981 RepID=A0A6A5T7E7_9PLEO|nr:hypothetical protein EJ02DRAFT_449099 [Clathrospora elynae]
MGRTFASKDPLKQQVQQVHLAASNDYIKRGLSHQQYGQKEDASVANPNALKCGFCQLILETTAARMDHVANYFGAF